MDLDPRLPGEIAVCGVGAFTPIGLTAAAAAAAVRAGISGFGYHPFMVDSEGRPMTVATLPGLSESDVVQRLMGALLASLREALGPVLPTVSSHDSVALLVGLPGPRPGLDEALRSRAERMLATEFGATIGRRMIAQVGHAAGLLAVAKALDLLREEPRATVVVAGADSWLDPDTLEWLEDTGQLHGAGKRNNAWGFVPGEAAGVLVLMSLAAAIARGVRPLAVVRAAGVGREHRLNQTGEVCLGDGLTQAFRAALAALADDERVSDIYCDMNGDPYRADEYGFTVSRTREGFDSPGEFVAAADCWGDVGAASGTLAIMLAVIAGEKGYAKGPHCLVWGSSNTGERGAVVLRCGVNAHRQARK